MGIRMLCAGLLLAAFALPASAQGVAGKWNASVDNQGFAFVMVFNFMVEGDELTGSLTNEVMGEVSISDGMIEGNALSFMLSLDDGQGGAVTVLMQGEVEGDEMTLKSSFPGGLAPPGSPAEQTLTAKRAI